MHKINHAKYESVIALREQGLTYRQIGDRLGLSNARVREMMLNAYYQRDYPDLHLRAKNLFLAAGGKMADQIRENDQRAAERRARWEASLPGSGQNAKND